MLHTYSAEVCGNFPLDMRVEPHIARAVRSLTYTQEQRRALKLWPR